VGAVVGEEGFNAQAPLVAVCESQGASGNGRTTGVEAGEGVLKCARRRDQSPLQGRGGKREKQERNGGWGAGICGLLWMCGLLRHATPRAAKGLCFDGHRDRDAAEDGDSDREEYGEQLGSIHLRDCAASPRGEGAGGSQGCSEMESGDRRDARAVRRRCACVSRDVLLCVCVRICASVFQCVSVCGI